MVVWMKILILVSRSRFIHLISNVETRNFEYISIRMLMNFIKEYPVPSTALWLSLALDPT